MFASGDFPEDEITTNPLPIFVNVAKRLNDVLFGFLGVTFDAKALRHSLAREKANLWRHELIQPFDVDAHKVNVS